MRVCNGAYGTIGLELTFNWAADFRCIQIIIFVSYIQRFVIYFLITRGLQM